LLGELEGNGRVVLCDMEAGLGTVSRILPGQLDIAVVVAEPTAKGIDIACRAAQIGANRARVIAVGNRVRGERDLGAIRGALGTHELIIVPEDPAILDADREGLAPIDVDAEAAGVKAILGLAELVASYRSGS
jgi:CO dehydrogenase nickel-insertion accessory protein CooC1